MQLAIRTMLLILGLSGLCSCSTIHKAVKHGKLEVQTKMSETVFLDPVADSKKTVLLQIRNTSDKKDMQITDEIKQAVEAKGFRVVTDPAKAQFMIQANILQVGKNNLDDPYSALTSGYGGALAGGVMGGVIADNWRGAGIGALAGGLIGTVADAAVQVVCYSMITDLQISEKANGTIVNESSDASLKQGTSGNKTSSWSQKTNWKRYQTRIISTAKKTNLKFEVALPELKQGLIQSISGLL